MNGGWQSLTRNPLQNYIGFSTVVAWKKDTGMLSDIQGYAHMENLKSYCILNVKNSS